MLLWLYRLRLKTILKIRFRYLRSIRARDKRNSSNIFSKTTNCDLSRQALGLGWSKSNAVQGLESVKLETQN